MAKDETYGLVEARVEAAARSRKEGRTVFIDVDDEGDCHLSFKESKMTISAYRNGSEVALSNHSEPETKTNKSMAKQAAKKEAPTKKAAAPKKEKEKTPRKWNPEPQFGFSEEAWKKLRAIGEKEGMSFVQLMRKTVAEKYKISE